MMLESDFVFLADRQNLEMALDLSGFLEEFKSEALQRYHIALKAAMQGISAQLAENWSLFIPDTGEEVELRPRPGSKIPENVWVNVGHDMDSDGDDILFFAPYWGVWAPKAKAHVKDTVQHAISPLIELPVLDDENYLIYGYAANFRNLGALDCLQAIIDDRGRVLAQQMADKALEIANALNTAFGA